MTSSGVYTSFKPESYLPRFTYFPLFFKPTKEVWTLDQSVESSQVSKSFQLEVDSQGRSSIIRMVDSDGNRISPFIDLSKYDTETKEWFVYGETDRLPYRYDGSNITNMYPSNIGSLSNFVVDELKFDHNKDEVTLSGYSADSATIGVFYKYAPIVLVAQNVPFTDLTDYTNITADPKKVATTTSSFEFFYDFEERLWTNQNLAGFNGADVKIIFNRIGSNSTKLKCQIASNSGARPKQTPIVYDYVLKLKGQYLRG